MHAIEVAELGGPEVLGYVETAIPSPGPGEVLIKADADRRQLRRHLLPVWHVSTPAAVHPWQRGVRHR